jgi:hypothetical protein
MRLNTVRHTHALQRSGVVSHAAACFYENALTPVLDYKTIQAGFDAVEFVARLVLRPKRFGDDAEHSSAVPPIRTRANARNPAIADIQNGIQLSQFRTS